MTGDCTQEHRWYSKLLVQQVEAESESVLPLVDRKYICQHLLACLEQDCTTSEGLFELICMSPKLFSQGDE
jgi:hypothetical protein